MKDAEDGKKSLASSVNGVADGESVAASALLQSRLRRCRGHRLRGRTARRRFLGLRLRAGFGLLVSGELRELGTQLDLRLRLCLGHENCEVAWLSAPCRLVERSASVLVGRVGEAVEVQSREARNEVSDDGEIGGRDGGVEDVPSAFVNGVPLCTLL